MLDVSRNMEHFSIMQWLKRCVVTGADGFIGRVLCRRLSEAGVDVLRLVHRPAGSGALVVDLGRDPVPSFEGFRPEAVFHLADRVHQSGDGSRSVAEHISATVDGTKAVLAASEDSGANAFIFFSSCAVLGEGVDRDLDENEPAAPTSTYGLAKLRAEEVVRNTAARGRLKAVSLRMPMVYGPGHKGSLPRMIAAIESGWFPPLPSYPGRRSVVHVNDVADAAILAAKRIETASETYIVSELRPYSSIEIQEIVRRALGRRSPRWHLPRGVLAAAAFVGDQGERLVGRSFPFDSRSLQRLSVPARYSAAKIRRELGFETSNVFADELPRLVRLGRSQ